MMPAKTSNEMRRALNLVKKGKSVAEASETAGVHRSALYRHKPYIEWRKLNKGK